MIACIPNHVLLLFYLKILQNYLLHYSLFKWCILHLRQVTWFVAQCVHSTVETH